MGNAERHSEITETLKQEHEILEADRKVCYSIRYRCCSVWLLILKLYFLFVYRSINGVLNSGPNGEHRRALGSLSLCKRYFIGHKI